MYEFIWAVKNNDAVEQIYFISSTLLILKKDWISPRSMLQIILNFSNDKPYGFYDDRRDF